VLPSSRLRRGARAQDRRRGITFHSLFFFHLGILAKTCLGVALCSKVFLFLTPLDLLFPPPPFFREVCDAIWFLQLSCVLFFFQPKNSRTKSSSLEVSTTLSWTPDVLGWVPPGLSEYLVSGSGCEKVGFFPRDRFSPFRWWCFLDLPSQMAPFPLHGTPYKSTLLPPPTLGSPTAWCPLPPTFPPPFLILLLVSTHNPTPFLRWKSTYSKPPG